MGNGGGGVRSIAEENLDSVTQRTVSENILRLRSIRGWSQADVTNHARTSLTPWKLGRVENGQRKLSASEVVELAIAFSVSPSQILLPWAAGRERIAARAVDGGQGSQTAMELQEWGMGRAYPMVLSPRTATYEAELIFSVSTSIELQQRLVEAPAPNTLATLVLDEATRRERVFAAEIHSLHEAAREHWSLDSDERRYTEQSDWTEATRFLYVADAARFFKLRERFHVHRTASQLGSFESVDTAPIRDLQEETSHILGDVGALFGTLRNRAGIEIVPSDPFDLASPQVVKWIRWPEFEPIPLGNAESAGD